MYGILWVADSLLGICRVDPDLYSPGPYQVNTKACPFGGFAALSGGAMAFDPSHNVVYLVDNQAKGSLGVLRANYIAGANNRNRSMDIATLFSLGGAPPNLCRSLPDRQDAPLSALPARQIPPLDPEGNLWAGFGKSSMILRFNSPATVTANTFGTCDQFMQQAATVAANHCGTGITFVGHDLWGATLEIMYTIRNADTICLVGQNPACSSANGTTQIVLPTIVGPTTITSDQTFP